jgi:oxygen-independent coproporphyrinogen III oxidase
MIPQTSEFVRSRTDRVPGLYIHIPFCVSKCHYCSFYSIPSVSPIPEFLRALFLEMEMIHDPWGPFDTVYIGGGTPSLLTIKQLESILARVQKCFRLLPDSEITLEANPGDLSLPFLRSLKSLGINRLNMGIQSFDQKSLDFLGRRHSPDQAISAIKSARLAGFRNLGLDLIYGIPGQNLASWKETVEQALASLPEHLSCYQLTLEEKTALGKRYRNGEFQLPEEDLQYDFFMKTSEWLEEAGYLHYEVSNFTRSLPFASRHNQKYWNHTPYLGFGPAAHSFQDGERWWNHTSLDRYLADIEERKLPVEKKENLTIAQLRLEALFLGLRTKRGISLQEFIRQYHSDLLLEKKEAIGHLERQGFLSIQNDHLVPTRAGLAVADSLALI